MRGRSKFAALSLFAGALACATVPRAPRGEIDLGYRAPVTAPASAATTHVIFRVEEGRITAPWLRLTTIDNDGGDECVVGKWSGNPLTLCAESIDAKGKMFGGEQVRWSGPTGDLTIELAPDGAAMHVEGRLYLGDDWSYRTLPLTAPILEQPDRYARVRVTLRLGLGAQWDEIRETPILFAVAAVTVGLIADPPVSPGFRPLTGD